MYETCTKFYIRAKKILFLASKKWMILGLYQAILSLSISSSFIIFSLSILSSTLGTRQVCYVPYQTVSSLSMLSSTICKCATYYTKLYPVCPCSIVHYTNVLRTIPNYIQSVHAQFFIIFSLYILSSILCKCATYYTKQYSVCPYSDLHYTSVLHTQTDASL